MTAKAILLVALILGFLSFRYGQDVNSLILDQTTAIKESYQVNLDAFLSWYDRYIDQAANQQQLERENRHLHAENLLYRHALARMVKERPEISSLLESSSALLRTQVVSYVNPPSFTRVWLSHSEPQTDRIYGLIYPADPHAGEGVAAGIALWSSPTRREALLNSDPKCAYAVVVGATSAPGIVMGQNSREMVVRYIPNWMSPAVGDEVITSGMDGIFYAGVKVGKVKAIGGDGAYKEAIIEPYFASVTPRHLYMITKL